MKIRRLLLVGVMYVGVAAVVLGVARTVARLLILPPLFMTLLAGIAVLGLPVALAVAWTYGGSEGPPDRGGGGEGPSASSVDDGPDVA